MSEFIDQVTSRRPRRQSYPWAEWCDALRTESGTIRILLSRRLGHESGRHQARTRYTTHMSEFIDQVNPRSRRPSYPWAEWFDGRARLLVYGTDFRATPKFFQGYIYARAAKAGVKVRTSLRLNGDVELQAVIPAADLPAAQ